MSDQTKFQTEVRTIHRSKITNAPYNPRIISDKAFTNLKKNLKKRGLMSTLTWNERSGNLVSGHQRLKALDQLEQKSGGDYTLTVSVVNLSDKEEKEQNIFFNSTTVQGQFDFEILNDILGDIDPFAAGFDENDLNILGVSFASDNFTDESQQENIDALAALKATKKETVKKAKEAARARADERYQDGETYVTLSFSTYNAKKAFMKRFGLNPDDLFVKGEAFNKICKYGTPED